MLSERSSTQSAPLHHRPPLHSHTHTTQMIAVVTCGGCGGDSGRDWSWDGGCRRRQLKRNLIIARERVPAWSTWYTSVCLLLLVLLGISLFFLLFVDLLSFASSSSSCCHSSLLFGLGMVSPIACLSSNSSLRAASASLLYFVAILVLRRRDTWILLLLRECVLLLRVTCVLLTW